MYIRERDYREYDSIISIRINQKYYSLLRRINKKNISKILRDLIRVDLYQGHIKITDNDVDKMLKIFTEAEIKKISSCEFRDKKNKLVNIRLFKEEKEQIKKRSEGNISYYIDLVIMDFIASIWETCKNNSVWGMLEDENNLLLQKQKK